MQLKISNLMKRVFPRLLKEEIDNQNKWLEETHQKDLKEVRKQIIEECKELLNQLEN